MERKKIVDRMVNGIPRVQSAINFLKEVILIC